MADSKVSALTALTAVTGDDLLYVVEDPSGTPAPRKATAAILAAYINGTLNQAITPGGRLTLESGVPISTTDQTAKTNVYYTPFIHNIINLWNGSVWTPISFTEYTLALGTITSGKPYDVFAYLNSGALALEMLVWTDDTTRATAVTLQDGRYCKSGDKTRLLLGTFYTTSTTTTEDSRANRYLSNVYNAVPRALFTCPGYVDDNSATTWTTTSTTWAEANSGTGSKVNYVMAIAGMCSLAASALADAASTFTASIGIGDDSAATAASGAVGPTGGRLTASPTLVVSKSPGRHYVSLLCRATGGTATYYADNIRAGGSVDTYLTALFGTIKQ